MVGGCGRERGGGGAQAEDGAWVWGRCNVNVSIFLSPQGCSHGELRHTFA